MARTKAAPAAEPVKIDQTNRRNDSEVLHGHMCRIEAGPYKGEVGTFTGTLTAYGDGYPETVHVELRSTNRTVVVDYADLTSVTFGH